ncbi:MAG: thiamine-phosphate kinase, partial [Acidimicrobiales bacterium]
MGAPTERAGGGELAAIERIRTLLPGPPAGETWIGDDAAVVAGPDGPLLLAADLVVAGVHADLDLVSLDDLGWKALAVNVSDLAAMGGHPLHALVSVAGPPTTDLDALYRGLAGAAAEWSCPVVGGDLANAPVLVVAVSVTGTTVGGRPAVLRSGARPGDTLFVTGPLGSSAAGLAALREARSDPIGWALAEAHRRPRARVG